MNWEALILKQIIPPFMPSVENNEDPNNFDSEFLDLPITSLNEQDFQTGKFMYTNFTYNRGMEKWFNFLLIIIRVLCECNRGKTSRISYSGWRRAHSNGRSSLSVFSLRNKWPGCGLNNFTNHRFLSVKTKLVYKYILGSILVTFESCLLPQKKDHLFTII